jgi:hypothetical protein
MVHIYYHIYVIDGVESIVSEQIELLKSKFNFEYNLNIGISIAGKNISTKKVLSLLDKTKIRDVRAEGHEFITLELLESDSSKFNDSDYVFYFHTKGASKLNDSNYENIEDWRNLMMYFNVEKVNDVFAIFERTKYNTFGCLLDSIPLCQFYSGNFWWAKADYIKTINLENVKRNRFNAELQFIQLGNNWKPYSIFNSKVNHYMETFPKEKYRI